MSNKYDMSPEITEVAQPQQDQQPSYGLPPMGTYAEKADIFEKMRPEEILETISFRLRGFIKDDAGEWKQDKDLKKIAITKIGAYDLANTALSVMTKNLNITTLDDNEIKARQMEITKALMAKIIGNWDAYNIKTVSQIRQIKAIITTQTYIALKAGYQAGARNVIKGTASEQHIFMTQPQHQTPKKGFVNRIFGRG